MKTVEKKKSNLSLILLTGALVYLALRQKREEKEVNKDFVK